MESSQLEGVILLRELGENMRAIALSERAMSDRLASIEVDLAKLDGHVASNGYRIDALKTRIEDLKHEVAIIVGRMDRLANALEVANALEEATESRRRAVHDKVHGAFDEAWSAFKTTTAESWRAFKAFCGSKPVQIGALAGLYGVMTALGLKDSGLLQEWLAYMFGLEAPAVP